MNDENEFSRYAPSPTGSAGGAESESHSSQEWETIIHKAIRWCKVCHISWMDTLHNDCPSCNSPEVEIGWYEYFDSSCEPSDSEIAPAEGGAGRSPATSTKPGDSRKDTNEDL